jgi:hypothetical protein
MERLEFLRRTAVPGQTPVKTTSDFRLPLRIVFPSAPPQIFRQF